MSRPLHRSELEADRAAGQALTGRVRTSLTAHTGRRQGEPAALLHSGSGQGLDSDVRCDMESRFGHSFADVRVHADGASASAAGALQALAFTHGRHIAFGPGQYAPHSPAGRQLLAHELAHVVQQTQPGGAPRIMLRPNPQLQGGGPLSETAKAGTDADRQEFAGEAAIFLRRQAEHFASLQPQRDPAVTLRSLRTPLVNGLQMLQALPATPDEASTLRTAYAEAVHRVLESYQAAQARAGSKSAPTLRALYQQHSSLIENFAQVFDAGADQLSSQLGAPLPKAASGAERSRHRALAQARRQLRVSTTPVDIHYAPYFDTRGGTTSMPLPPRTSVRLAGGMATTLHGGLTSVAADLIDRKVLGPQIILTLALDLTPYGGGHDAYRFTRIDVGSGGGTRSEVWIERQGTILSEGLTQPQRAALELRFRRLGFQNENIGTQEFDEVLLALSEVPESQLAGVRGLSFRRESVHPTNPKAAATYHPGTHTIRIFDLALAQSLTRLGRQGRVLRYATHAIVHEIGHALDMSGLRQADSAFGAANKDLLDNYGTGGGSYQGPDSKDPDRPRFDATLKAFKQAQKDRLKARGRSGARWVSVGGAPLSIEDKGPGREPTPAFRAAALKDDGAGGPRVPTTRPKPEPVWQEYYAESFALYQSSPDLLKRIRPHVFAHLAAEFPK
ncbi:MAG: DUF4157 domain-containing protein [Rubrivivax sp.]|nr:DUF4157 domain-containing protein [Rubrivivax sp.]